MVAPVMAQDVKVINRYHGPVIIDEISPDGKTATSQNWSGYASAKNAAGAVKTVKASWTVPSVNCANSQPNSYSSFWVGIDGAGSKSVEQTGTDSDCQGGKPSYFAWYEFYPKPSVGIKNFTVQPGDHITASVTHSGTNYTLVLINNRTKQKFHKTSAVSAAKAVSAEWIAEAPAGRVIEPLSDFGTVLFGNDHTGVANTCTASIGKTSGPISKLPNVVAITLANKTNGDKAVPSALSSDGTSFSVKWAH